MNQEISEGAREYVDLSAEAVGALGVHLHQIGGIISKSTGVPRKGFPTTAKKLKDKYELYSQYAEEVKRRKKEIEDKMKEDYEKMMEWRKESGNEGASLLEELENNYNRIRELNKLLAEERDALAEEKEKVRGLIALIEKKDRKWKSLSEGFVKIWDQHRRATYKHRGLSSWTQCAFDEIRFRFKAEQEKERLRVEHHQKMRKARAQSRLDVIHREQSKRQLQICFLGFQEEAVERRHERFLEELRRRYEDERLVFQGRVAQLLGDEEQAKKIVEEQVRRMEEAKAQTREAQRLEKLAKRAERQAKEEAEAARQDAAAARQAQAQAEAERDEAKADAEESRARAKNANDRADASDIAKQKALDALRKAEIEVKKKAKKIESLQRMLAELGAESDSDAPPDERAPPFFTNEDGSKEPRPRTRKERMAMAYREAESARCELRLGMAAMIDKDARSGVVADTLREQLAVVQREVQQVRKANEELAAEANALEATMASASSSSARRIDIHAPLPEPPTVPLAPSTAAVPPFDPTRPAFEPAKLETPGSPRLLLKTASTPILMPTLTGTKPAVPEKLAPLRKVKRDKGLWKLDWH